MAREGFAQPAALDPVEFAHARDVLRVGQRRFRARERWRVDVERLAQALKQASRLQGPQLLGLGSPAAPLAARQHVAVRVRDELKLIPVKDIRYFRADQKYVTVRHNRGEDLIDESLKQLEEEFAHDFVRAHRSVLVAIAHVEALERVGGDEGYALRLRGEAEPIAVSRRQLAELRKRLASH